MTEIAAKNPPAAPLAMIEGKIIPLEQARIALADRGFLFGEAIFETILVRRAQPVCLEDHLERLKSSVSTLGWTVDFARLEKDIGSLCAAAASRSALKIIVSGGCNDSFETLLPVVTNVYLILTPLAATSDERSAENRAESSTTAQTECLRLLALPDPRAAIGIRMKTTGYFPNAQALQVARSQGFNDALFYDSLNQISEATSAAFVWLSSSGDLRAAPAGSACFDSITVNRLARALPQLDLTEKSLNREALNLANAEQDCVAAVLLSSVRGARPICEIGLPGSRSLRFDSGTSIALSHKINALLESG